jgi:hypothetical protein
MHLFRRLLVEERWRLKIITAKLGDKVVLKLTPP